MTDERIIEGLKSQFERHRLVFWYDTKHEFKDDFNSPDNWIGEPIEGCNFKININSKDKNKSNGELILKGKNVFARYLEESLNKTKTLFGGKENNSSLLVKVFHS